jgi:hypothetical protein
MPLRGTSPTRQPVRRKLAASPRKMIKGGILIMRIKLFIALIWISIVGGYSSSSLAMEIKTFFDESVPGGIERSYITVDVQDYGDTYQENGYYKKSFEVDKYFGTSPWGTWTQLQVPLYPQNWIDTFTSFIAIKGVYDGDVKRINEWPNKEVTPVQEIGYRHTKSVVKLKDENNKGLLQLTYETVLSMPHPYDPTTRFSGASWDVWVTLENLVWPNFLDIKYFWYLDFDYDGDEGTELCMLTNNGSQFEFRSNTDPPIPWYKKAYFIDTMNPTKYDMGAALLGRPFSAVFGVWYRGPFGEVFLT